MYAQFIFNIYKIKKREACSVMAFGGNGFCDQSSNPGWSTLQFT